jgi:histone acetyltransferase 1
LNINLYFNSSNLYTYLNYTFDQKKVLKNDPTPIDILTNRNLLNMEYYAIQTPFTSDIEEFKTHLNDKFTPPGTKIHSYSHNKTTFEIYKSDIESCRDYYQICQIFSLFFIEGSSYIDINDTKWEIFFLFEKKINEKNEDVYEFAGYSACYPFFCYPESIRYKVSHFLIMGKYQKQGNGTKLLQAIYRDAVSQKVEEICFESPNENMQLLRDLLDLSLVSQEVKNIDEMKWDDDFYKTIKEKLKLTKHQTRKCYEILKFEKLKSDSKI